MAFVERRQFCEADGEIALRRGVGGLGVGEVAGNVEGLAADGEGGCQSAVEPLAQRLANGRVGARFFSAQEIAEDVGELPVVGLR